MKAACAEEKNICCECVLVHVVRVGALGEDHRVSVEVFIGKKILSS